MLQLNSINLKYGQKSIFNNANINIPANKLTLILGKSGIGKTSLLYMLGLVSSNKEYEYLYCGKKINLSDENKKAAIKRNDIGFIFQDKNLYSYLTVKENLHIYCEISSIDFTPELAQEYLNKVHLKCDLNDQVALLSGGEKQRLAIACVLIKNPKIIIADEPTSSLDQSNRDNIMRIFKEFTLNNGTVIIATHDENIQKYADYIYEIKNQKIECIKEFSTSIDNIENNLKYEKIKSKFFWNFNLIKLKHRKLQFLIINFLQSLIITFICMAFLIKDPLIDKYVSGLAKLNKNEIYVSKLNDITFNDEDVLELKNIGYIKEVVPVFVKEINSVILNNQQINDRVTIVSDNQLSGNEITISPSLRKYLNVGDTINLKTINNNEYKVIDISKDSSHVLSNTENIIYVPLESISTKSFSNYLLKINSYRDYEIVIQSLNKINQDYFINIPFTNYKNIIELENSYSKQINDITITLTFITISLLVITTLFNVNSKKYEICILKANGLNNKNLFNLYMKEQILNYSLNCFYIFNLMVIFNQIIQLLFNIRINSISFNSFVLVIFILLFVNLIPMSIGLFKISRYSPEKLLRN